MKQGPDKVSIKPKLTANKRARDTSVLTAANLKSALASTQTHRLDTIDLDNLSKKACDFVKDRNWETCDTPLTLMLALTAEVGELSELYTWLKDDTTEISLDRAVDTLLELADVVIYTLRLCRIFNTDLNQVKRNLSFDKTDEPTVLQSCPKSEFA